MEPVRHIVALGCRCAQSSIFKTLGHRRYACPFDWIFSCPEMVLHCLEDDFKCFLDRNLMYVNGELFDSIGLPPGSAPRQRKLIGHTVYSEMLQGVGRGTIFNHRNPLEIESDHEYMIRSVDRFRSVLKSPDRKLFVVLNINPRLWNETALRQLFLSLAERTDNFELVALNCQLELGQQASLAQPQRICHESINSAQLDMWNVPCAGANSGSYFRDALDAQRVQDIVLAPYEFKLSADPLDLAFRSPPTQSPDQHQGKEARWSRRSADTKNEHFPQQSGQAQQRRWARSANLQNAS